MINLVGSTNVLSSQAIKSFQLNSTMTIELVLPQVVFKEGLYCHSDNYFDNLLASKEKKTILKAPH